jgi:phospholipid:diacylglycerol acyltransferase
MAELRKRLLADQTPEVSREPTPDKAEELQLVAKSRLKELKERTHHPRSSRRRGWFIFLLGGLLGLLAAAIFAADRQDVINLQGLAELNFDNLIDVIPASIIKDAKDITVSSTSTAEPACSR